MTVRTRALQAQDLERRLRQAEQVSQIQQRRHAAHSRAAPPPTAVGCHVTGVTGERHWRVCSFDDMVQRLTREKEEAVAAISARAKEFRHARRPLAPRVRQPSRSMRSARQRAVYEKTKAAQRCASAAADWT
jgi:hypothetical protein